MDSKFSPLARGNQELGELTCPLLADFTNQEEIVGTVLQRKKPRRGFPPGLFLVRGCLPEWQGISWT